MSLAKIEALHADIEASIFNVDPPLDYDDVLTSLIELVGLVESYCPDDDDNSRLWSIGENGCADLGSLLVGVYWYCVDYHDGQSSPEYVTQCAIRRVYTPGPCTDGPEHESTEAYVYDAMEALHPPTK